MAMRRIIPVCMLFFAFIFCAKDAFAGAWTVPKYRVWSEMYLKWDWSKDTFNESTERTSAGDHVKNFRNWEFVMEPKFEYGVTDWFTGLFSLEYKEAHYKEYDRPINWGTFVRKNHGLTNIKFGARVRLIDNPLIVSTQTKIFMYPGYGIDHGDDAAYHNQPGIGYGDNAVEQRVLIGKTYAIPITQSYKLPWYFGAETGYRWRSGPVCNDIPYFIETGVWPRPWLLIKTELDGYKTQGGTGSIKTGYGIWRIGGVWQVFGDSVLRQGDKLFNIEFQYGMTLWGKNTNDAQELVLKIQTQF